MFLSPEHLQGNAECSALHTSLPSIEVSITEQSLFSSDPTVTLWATPFFLPRFAESYRRRTEPICGHMAHRRRTDMCIQIWSQSTSRGVLTINSLIHINFKITKIFSVVYFSLTRSSFLRHPTFTLFLHDRDTHWPFTTRTSLYKLNRWWVYAIRSTLCRRPSGLTPLRFPHLRLEWHVWRGSVQPSFWVLSLFSSTAVFLGAEVLCRRVQSPFRVGRRIV